MGGGWAFSPPPRDALCLGTKIIGSPSWDSKQRLMTESQPVNFTGPPSQPGNSEMSVYQTLWALM